MNALARPCKCNISILWQRLVYARVHVKLAHIVVPAPPGPSVSGGRQGADLSVICQCVEVARIRHTEVSQLLTQQLESFH